MTLKSAAKAVPNILCIVCAAIFIWNYAHKGRSSGDASDARITVGTLLPLPSVSLKDSSHTVLVAVSTTCPYCRASSGFYKKLAQNASIGHFNTVAVLPESVEAAHPFFPNLGITRFSHVQEANFGKLGVHATPTLVILDNRSRVEALWVGKLNPEQELEVYAKLGMTIPSSDSSSTQSSPQEHPIADQSSDMYVPPQEAKTLLRNSAFVLVDVRPRSVFDGAHLDRALNMPLDEFSSRATHELPEEKNLLIYCGVYALAGCSAAGEDQDGIATSCHAAQNAFSHLKVHYNKVRYLAAELSLLSQFGGSVVGTACN